MHDRAGIWREVGIGELIEVSAGGGGVGVGRPLHHRVMRVCVGPKRIDMRFLHVLELGGAFWIRRQHFYG